jgi:AcrR family transcriptional regulator
MQQSVPEVVVRQRRKAARPGELIAAALELFVERGFAATKLDDVAARAGVSKGTLYLYFTSKEELFKAVIQQGILPVVAQGEKMIEEHTGDSATLLRNLIIRWWELVDNSALAGIPKLIVSEAGNFPEVARYFHDNVSKSIDELLGKVLRSGIEKGEFRAIDIDSAIDVITAPVLMRSIWRFSMEPYSCRGVPDPQAYLNTHIDLLLNGLQIKETAHE